MCVLHVLGKHVKTEHASEILIAQGRDSSNSEAESLKIRYLECKGLKRDSEKAVI